MKTILTSVGLVLALAVLAQVYNVGYALPTQCYTTNNTTICQTYNENKGEYNTSMIINSNNNEGVEE